MCNKTENIKIAIEELLQAQKKAMEDLRQAYQGNIIPELPEYVIKECEMILRNITVSTSFIEFKLKEL